MVAERYHFGSGVTVGSSGPDQSALGFPPVVQAIHSSVFTSMIPPMMGTSGLVTRDLGLGGGTRLPERVLDAVGLEAAAGDVGLEVGESPSVLRDVGVEPVSVMTMIS